jgi:hypothetical protein
VLAEWAGRMQHAAARPSSSAVARRVPRGTVCLLSAAAIHVLRERTDLAPRLSDGVEQGQTALRSQGRSTGSIPLGLNRLAQVRGLPADHDGQALIICDPFATGFCHALRGSGRQPPDQSSPAVRVHGACLVRRTARCRWLPKRVERRRGAHARAAASAAMTATSTRSAEWAAGSARSGPSRASASWGRPRLTSVRFRKDGGRGGETGVVGHGRFRGVLSAAAAGRAQYSGNDPSITPGPDCPASR